MKVCPKCKVPNIVGRDQIWQSNGIITIPSDENFRMGILETEVMVGIAGRLEAIIGPSVNKMFEEGKRKYARHYIDGLLKGPLGFLVRHSQAAGKKAYLTVIETAVGLGYGKVILEFYERKKRVGGTVHNPYFPPLFLGDVRGAFESIERLPSRGIWEPEGDSAKISVERLEGEDRLEERFRFEDVERIPGDIKYTPCKGCRLPTELSRFKWDMEAGTITDTKGGDRVFMVGLNDLNAVFHELEEAIGEMVSDAILETNREYGHLQVERGIIKGYDDLEAEMAIKGLALTKISGPDKDGVVRFTFDNFFNRHYLVGRALGVYQGLEGVAGEAEVKEGTAHLQVTVRRASGGKGGKDDKGGEGG